MNSHQRRVLRRMISRMITEAQGGEVDQSMPREPSQQQPQMQASPSRKQWWRTVEIAATIVGILGFLGFLYLAWPSWSVSLPSTAYRPRNPFTAIFTVSNVGYVSAKAEVVCKQNLIKYLEPANIFSNGVSKPLDLGDISRNEARTFSCPQIFAGIKVIPGVLTEEQIKADYEAGRKVIEETGHPPNEDMPFDWVDFEFQLKYSVPLVPFRFTDSYRVVGKPGQNGTFVWELVDPRKVF